MADEFDPKEFEALSPVAKPAFDPKEFGASPAAGPAKITVRPYAERVTDIPEDVGTIAGEGLNTAVRAPEKILGNEPVDAALLDKLVKSGVPQEKAEGLARRVQGNEGILDLFGGPMQTLFSPATGIFRSMGSRPVEEATGIPKEATEAVAGLAMGRPRVTRPQNPAPLSGALHAEANTGYTVARSYPIQFMPNTTENIANNIEAALRAPRLAFREHTAGKTWAELEYLRNPETHFPTFSDIDAARTSLGRIAREVDARGFRTPDAGAASHAIEMLDNAVLALRPTDTLSGGHLLPNLHQTLAEARSNYSAYVRTKIVEDTFDKARRAAAKSGSGANIENQIRSKFDSILNNEKLLQRYTQDEVDLMREVVGEHATGRNVARAVGKLAPSGVVSAGGSMGIGALLGAKGAERALPWGIGYIAKHIADSRARAAAQRMIDATARRSPYYQSLPQPAPQFRANALPSIAAGQTYRNEEEP